LVFVDGVRVVVPLFGVMAGDAHGAVVAPLFAVPLFAALFAVPCGFAVDVAEPGVVLLGLVVVIAGHGAGAVVFVVVVEVVPAPVVDDAPAGTFEFGLVVDVAEAGVEPVVFVVPFCCVVDVADAGVLVLLPAGVVVLGVGWIPGEG
jgi:hypothetical protein